MSEQLFGFVITLCSKNVNSQKEACLIHAILLCQVLFSLLICFTTYLCYFFPDVDECAIGPCQNGGQCVDLINAYRCNCAAGYTGRNCELSKYNELDFLLTY